MSTVLLPCDGSASALLAVRHAVRAFRRGDVQLIHLLNVQPPFSAYVARHVDRAVREDYHRECADVALAEARQLLDADAVPYVVHSEVGSKVLRIAEAARRLRCDRVLVGSVRRSTLVHAVANSLTDQLLERCPVPVELVGGAPASAIDRLGIPAGVGASTSLLLASAS
jgi:nucleotide-binding universal stress UspA family protein